MSASALAPSPVDAPMVVVAEDERTIGDMVSAILEDYGYQVRLASDGEACMQLLKRSHQDVAAVLLDLTLPRLGGAEVLRQLRDFAPKLPVVIMSGDLAAASDAARQGAASCLAKPFRASELRTSVALAVAAHG